MPVDFTGLLIAFLVWLGGTIWAFRRLRAPRQAPLQIGAVIALTMCASVVLALVGVFIVWFYDWVHGRA